MFDFLFALIEIFSLSNTVPSYDAKCVQLGCFHKGSTSLQSTFIRTGSSPTNHSWHQKTRGTGLYPVMKTVSFCVFWFDTISQCDKQRDGRTDRQRDGYAAHNACKTIALRCAVIKKL